MVGSHGMVIQAPSQRSWIPEFGYAMNQHAWRRRHPHPPSVQQAMYLTPGSWRNVLLGESTGCPVPTISPTSFLPKERAESLGTPCAFNTNRVVLLGSVLRLFSQIKVGCYGVLRGHDNSLLRLSVDMDMIETVTDMICWRWNLTNSAHYQELAGTSAEGCRSRTINIWPDGEEGYGRHRNHL